MKFKEIGSTNAEENLLFLKMVMFIVFLQMNLNKYTQRTQSIRKRKWG